MDFAARRYWLFLPSLVVILLGALAMAVPPAFRVGIDFTGGSAITVSFEEPVAQGEVRAALSRLGHPEAQVQRVGRDTFLIRTRELQEPRPGEEGPSEKERVQEALAGLAPIKTFEFASVSPAVARETVRNAAIAVIAASIAILLYIAWAFRRVPRPLRMGVAAVLGLIHDVLIVLSLFALLGKFLPVQVDALFIAGILAVVGYSVNNTVVTFDRVRENILKGVSRDLGVVVNLSIWETMGRSLNTSLTTLFVILALFLLGGPTIRNFLLVLLIGVTAGTYSSLFIAGPLLVAWEKGEWLGPFTPRRPSPLPTGGGPAS